MAVATAAWSTRDLYASLGHHGWGILDDVVPGVRKTLEALIYQLPYGSGAGTSTVAQIAEWAHLSTRWVRRCLYQLEALHLISWRRGTIRDGKATPSTFRVNKTALVQAIHHTAAKYRAALAAKRAREAARVAQLGNLRPRNHRNPLSDHAELNTYLPFPKGSDPAGGPQATPTRQDTSMRKQPCIHGVPDINTCGMCRMEIRRNPGMNVTTLWADNTPPTTDPHGWRERVRAATRQAREEQPRL